MEVQQVNRFVVAVVSFVPVVRLPHKKFMILVILKYVAEGYSLSLFPEVFSFPILIVYYDKQIHIKST